MVNLSVAVGSFTGTDMAVAVHLEGVSPAEKLAGLRQFAVALGQVKPFVQLSLMMLSANAI